MNSLKRGRILLDVWRVKRAPRSVIERRQRRRLEELLSFVRVQSRFYKRHYADVPEDTTVLEAFPPVTKPMLMEQFDDVVTDTALTKDAVDEFLGDDANIGRRFLGRYPVWTTSGTTGEPGIFVQDDTALFLLNVLPDRWLWPSLAERNRLTQLLKHNIRGAEIAVTGGHFAGASGVALMQRESKSLQHRIQLFSPTQPLAELISELNEYQPAFLVGYSTVLVELAHAKRDGRLDITPAIITPTAEPIPPGQKHDVAAAFECPVREVYGATECFPIAVECGHGNLHVNSDWVVLEPVDDTYQPVAPGEPSATVLVTSLTNRVQPLVRYDLGDSITMFDEPCPCGSAFPVIEVEGRQRDVLHLETDEGDEVPLFPLSLATVVEEVSGVHRTQIIQTAPTTLRVRLDMRDDRDEQTVWDSVDEALRSYLVSQNLSDITIEHASESPQRNPASGKYRHVWSETDR
jgi:phenylacetate-CoA ligase